MNAGHPPHDERREGQQASVHVDLVDPFVDQLRIHFVATSRASKAPESAAIES